MFKLFWTTDNNGFQNTAAEIEKFESACEIELIKKWFKILSK